MSTGSHANAADIGRDQARMQAPSQRLRISSLAFIALFLAAFVPSIFVDATAANAAPDDTTRQVLITAIFLALLGGTFRLNDHASNIALPKSLLALFSYCAFTILWSPVPFIAVRRLTLTTMVAWMIFRSIREIGPYRALKYLQNIQIFVVFLCYAAVFFSPFGVHHDFMDPPSVAGSWRGIFLHKNIAGAFFSLTILCFTFSPIKMEKLIRFTTIILSVFFLIGTRSKTSIGVLFIALVAGWIARKYRPRYASLVVVFAITAAFLSFLAISFYWGDFIAVIDDPDGFTGRGQIWQLLLNFAQSHLWEGTGYGSFWQVGYASPIAGFTEEWIAELGHGHNGFLDLLVTIGLPGLIFAIFCIFVVPFTQLITNTKFTTNERALYFSGMIFIFGHNITESSILDRISVLEVFTMTFISLINVRTSNDHLTGTSIKGRITSIIRRELNLNSRSNAAQLLKPRRRLIRLIK